MKCIKDIKKECHIKIITPEYEEYPACIDGAIGMNDCIVKNVSYSLF